jgi:hypothetical protein
MHDPDAKGAHAPVPDSPGLHAKLWWRPFAVEVADRLMQGAPILRAATEAADAFPDDAFPPFPGGIGNAIAACATGREWSLRRSIPRDGSPLARALWRHLQFAFGCNVNLGGLFLARAEASDAEYALAEDIANILAILARGSNAGADRWRAALGYGGGGEA